LELKYTQGDAEIRNENDNKWKEALMPLLVDKETARSFSGNKEWCSMHCLDENGKENKFVDACRF